MSRVIVNRDKLADVFSMRKKKKVNKVVEAPKKPAKTKTKKK